MGYRDVYGMGESLLSVSQTLRAVFGAGDSALAL